MSELTYQLGIDWKLLISQGANFLILLGVLTFVLWKPLLKVIEERRKKIELGLEVGEEAARRLAQIDKQKTETIAKAEEEAMLIARKSELEAKENADKLMAEGAKRGADILLEAQDIADRRSREAKLELLEEAKALVRSALMRTVELSPEKIDDALISTAINEIKKKGP